MKISLRKANAVQNSINEAIRGIAVKTSVEINEFQDAETQIRKANELLVSQDHRRHQLLSALYDIRSLVGSANAASGIDSKLASAALVDKRVSQIEELAKAEPVTDMSVLVGKLDKIRNRKDEGRVSIYGREDSITTSVLTTAQIDQFKEQVKELKKRKQKLNDEILELNIKTEITLSDEVVNTLKVEGLI